MDITKKIIDYLEQPEFINFKKFCDRYIELSELYWSLADESQVTALKNAESTLLSKCIEDKLPDSFKGMSMTQIQNHFHQQLIKLYSRIPENQAKLIQKEINDYLRSNNTYTTKLKLKVPKNVSLKIIDYYINYLIVKDNLPYIEIKAKGIKK